jgi:rifampicin phosphotransferase
VNATLAVDVPVDEPWDPTHTSGQDAQHWTTTNLGEAAPGVLTPLASSLWNGRISRAGARAAAAIGVLSEAERNGGVPSSVRMFYGRVATALEFMGRFGDRMPGITGPDTIVSLLNEVPPTMSFHPTRRRYGMIVTKLGYRFVTQRRRMLALCAEADAWWRQQVEIVPTLVLPEALDMIGRGAAAYERLIGDHMILLFASVQPTFDAAARLIQRTGVGDLGVLCGAGGAEIDVVCDIWRASRGEIAVEDVVRSYGFHGPAEGEVSSAVWRDDASPLLLAIEHYKSLPDQQAPMRLEQTKRSRMAAMTEEVVAAMPAKDRPGARLVLKLARERVPDRGRGKRAFLQAIDVTRLAARRAGELLFRDAVLDQPDDIFYLTEEESAQPLPRDVKELIAKRRERRELYERFEFAHTRWRGSPELVRRDAGALETERMHPGQILSGKGASSGVVEGEVRVVRDPTFEDVQPGEVLVASTTDPSWCSIMFASAALVVDLGGLLSHAAVVARELDIPCIVDARDATRRLKTGDRVKVDGNAGTVELLARPDVAR